MVVAAAVVTVAVTRRRRRRCGGIGGGRWRRERPRARTTWPRLDQPDPSHEHARPRLDRAGLVSTNPDRLQGRMVVPFRSALARAFPRETTARITAACVGPFIPLVLSFLSFSRARHRATNRRRANESNPRT